MTTLKVGSKNECIFSFSHASIDNINGFLSLNMDLSFLISIDATKGKNNREFYNYIINHKYEQFAIQGICFGNICFTGIESFLQNIAGSEILLKSNIALIGTQIFEKDLKANIIQSARTYFSGMCPVIKEMPSGMLNSFNCIISFDYLLDNKAKKSIGGINFEFAKPVSVLDYLDLISDINSLFSLFNNKPSCIEKAYIKINNNDEYLVYANWIIDNSRNIKLIVKGVGDKSIVCNMTDLLNKWLDFTSKAQIAIQQYFSVQAMNKLLYEQMILFNEISSLEGMLTAYQNQERTLKERLYSLLLLNVELQEAIKNVGIDIEGFLTDVINIRNMYAHCSDRKINKLQKVDYYKYSVIINFMIRTLLIKNVLGLTQVVIDIEEL